MMSDRHTLFPACLALTLALGAASACSRSLPTAPEAPSFSSSGALASSSGDPAITFPLTDGTLILTAAKGETLTGTYTGEARFRSGVETATLAVTVTGGTAGFSGATGTLVGDGDGAFTGEGTASLTLQGVLARADGSSFKLRTTLKGRSEVSCDDNRIRLTIRAEGTATGAGRVSAVLSHLVGNAGCS